MLTVAKVLRYPTLPTYVHMAGINRQNSSVLLCMCEETALVHYSAGQQSCMFISVHIEYYYYGNYWCCVVQGKHNFNPLEWDEQNSRYNYYSNWGQDKQLCHPSVKTRWWCGVNTMWLYTCLFRSMWHQQQISEQSTWELQHMCISRHSLAHSHLRRCINASSCSTSLSSHCLSLTLPSLRACTNWKKKKCWLWAGWRGKRSCSEYLKSDLYQLN